VEFFSLTKRIFDTITLLFVDPSKVYHVKTLNILSTLLMLGCLPAALVAADEPPRPDDKVLEQESVPDGGDFTLMSSEGPVSTRQLRGKSILVYFGYTKCPDVCPTSLSFITQALNELTEEELKQVATLFISVDPKRDTPEVLAQYVGYFHDHIIGATGSEGEIAELARRYGVKYREVKLEGSAFGYSVDHSSATYLIAPNGELRYIFPHNTPAFVIVEAVRYLQQQEMK
jgi:protein SCO1/2